MKKRIEIWILDHCGYGMTALFSLIWNWLMVILFLAVLVALFMPVYYGFIVDSSFMGWAIIYMIILVTSLMVYPEVKKDIQRRYPNRKSHDEDENAE